MNAAPSVLAGNVKALDRLDSILAKRERKARTVANRKRYDVDRSDFLAFRRSVGRDESGNPLIEDNYSRIYCTTIAYCHDNAVHLNHKAPPGLGKSMDARTFFAFKIGQDVRITTGTISGDTDAAKDGCSLVRQIILSPDVRERFPEIVPDYERSRVDRKAPGMNADDGADPKDSRGWRQEGWFLRDPKGGIRKDPTMGAYAAVPKREDLRIKMLLADDVITERIAHSAAERAPVERAFFNTWMEGRLSNGGWCCYLQNHRADDDLGDKLRNDGRFCSLFIGVNDDFESMFVRLWNPPDHLPLLLDPAAFGCAPVESPREGADVEFEMPLPARPGWDAQTLRSRNVDAVNQLYKLKGRKPDDLMFPSFPNRNRGDGVGIERHRTACELLGVEERDFLPVFKPGDLGNRFNVALGLDISGSKRKGNVLTLAAKTWDHRIIPVMSYRCAMADDWINLVDRLWGAGIHFGKLVIEDNAAQSQIIGILGKMARENNSPWRHRIEAFTTTASNKPNPEIGLPAIEMQIKSGEIVWPDGELNRVDPVRSNGHTVYAPWSEGMRALTDDMNNCARHCKPGCTPDGAMSFWFALHGLGAFAPGQDRGRLKLVHQTSSSRTGGGQSYRDLS